MITVKTTDISSPHLPAFVKANLKRSDFRELSPAIAAYLRLQRNPPLILPDISRRDGFRVAISL